jgi:hypothetical protein
MFNGLNETSHYRSGLTFGGFAKKPRFVILNDVKDLSTIRYQEHRRIREEGNSVAECSLLPQYGNDDFLRDRLS